MIEREIRDNKEIIDFIYDLIEKKELRIQELEEKSGISLGCISRWKKRVPRFDSMLLVLSELNAKVILRVDDFEENSGDNERKIQDDDVEEQDLLDILIYHTLKKALRNCSSLSDKEKLYKILQAFL